MYPKQLASEFGITIPKLEETPMETYGEQLSWDLSSRQLDDEMI